MGEIGHKTFYIKCYISMFNVNTVTGNLPFVTSDKMELQEVPKNEGSDIDLLFHKSSLTPLGFLSDILLWKENK